MISFPVLAQEHWSVPQPVVEIVGDFNTAAPFLSSDGKSLYFRSDQIRQKVATRFYVATRLQPQGQFTAVIELAVLNDANVSIGTPRPDGLVPWKAPSTPIDCLWISNDDLRMYYTESGLSRGGVVYTERQSVTDPWRRGSRKVLGNRDRWSLGMIYGRISLTQDELFIAATSSGGLAPKGSPPHYELQYATRSNISENFNALIRIEGFNSLAPEGDPFIMPDGLSIYFVSTKDSEGYKIFKAVRANRNEGFGNVQLVDDLDIPECNLRCPALSADGTVIYFEVQRPISDRVTKSDIYYSEIIKEPAALARHLVEHAIIEKEAAGEALTLAQAFEHEAIRNLEIAQKDTNGISRKSLLKAKILLGISLVRDKIADEAIQKSLDDLEKLLDDGF
jgi:hypothetical protein